ncbi:pectinesterase inhibitor 7-like [Prosopis cineraria]|uniref:pectinesterase inhibitor 7-like n=1 Tax=Prosopis cineraria TaxID=364024 RepID=UPI00240EC6FF|nr:pectinesterase inhibitor 7-like [Prosopis cineraria]
MKTPISQLLSLLLLLLAATFFLIPPTLAAATDFIRSACNTTDNPDLCYSSISPYAKVIKQSPAVLARIGITVAQPVIRRVASDVSALSGKANSSYAGAFSVCEETLGTAVDNVGDALSWMRQLEEGKGGSFEYVIKAVNTQLSGAMTNEMTCTDEFEPDGPVKKEVVDRVTYAFEFTGIALSLVTYYANHH